MEKVINHGIPHIGEKIFESMDTPGLFTCLLVSKSWRELAENVLIESWRDRMSKACKNGETKIVQLLLKRRYFEDCGVNTVDGSGSTSLIWACANGHKDIVQLLLDHSDPNAKCKKQYGIHHCIYACLLSWTQKCCPIAPGPFQKN